jgi:hypothetical protein
MTPDHWTVLRAWLRREMSRAHHQADDAFARFDTVEGQRARERAKLLYEVGNRMSSIGRANRRRRVTRHEAA